MDYRFKVNLKGVISILSNHLYSTPDVFLRELTQNCCDAITARNLLDPSVQGAITYELTEADRPVLMIEDNGCGLTEEEIHQFLATIGMSSNREEEDLIAARSNFIGQFGIGLLSAFMVCDEIVVYTRSHKEGSQAYEWRGHSDGTYSLKKSSLKMDIGTKVFIHASDDSIKHFEAENIKECLSHYCRFLPVDLRFTVNDQETVINQNSPWQQELPSIKREELALDLAAEHFNKSDILDIFPLESDFVSGYAYLMPASSLGGARRNAVYIRNMFINDGVTDLLPDWACIFGIIINSDDLTPSASRESLHEDGFLQATRKDLERSLNVYLQRLSVDKPTVLANLIQHYESLLKNIAAQNEDFFKIIYPHLTYDSSIGRLSFKDLQEQAENLYFVSDNDEFHKVAPIASSSGHIIIKAGYSFEPTLMKMIQDLPGKQKLEPLDSSALLSCIKTPSSAESANWDSLLQSINKAFKPFNLKAQLCCFQPAQIPLIYFEDEQQREARRLSKYQEGANDLFSSLLSDIQPEVSPRDILVNIENPIILSLKENSSEALEPTLKLLYVQALLLGRHPLGVQELDLLNNNLSELIKFNLLK